VCSRLEIPAGVLGQIVEVFTLVRGLERLEVGTVAMSSWKRLRLAWACLTIPGILNDLVQLFLRNDYGVIGSLLFIFVQDIRYDNHLRFNQVDVRADLPLLVNLQEDEFDLDSLLDFLK
jgi:hypothetical protein